MTNLFADASRTLITITREKKGFAMMLPQEEIEYKKV